MKEALFSIIRQYGYMGIFFSLFLGIVGLPVPDEIIMIFTGFLIVKGTLMFVPAVTSAFAGSISGMSISFFIGHFSGDYLKKKKYLFSKIDKAHKWFERFGKLSVIIGYFIPGLRQVTAYVSGMSEWKYKYFVLSAALGGLLWTSCLITLGYYLGDKWEIFSEILHKYLKTVSIISILALTIIIFLFYSRNRKSA